MDARHESFTGNTDDARISVRIKKNVKEGAENILKELGLNLTEGINIYLHKIIMENGIPFDMRLPRSEVIGSKAAAMESAAKDAVMTAIANNRAKGIPPVRYDPSTGTVYTEDM